MKSPTTSPKAPWPSPQEQRLMRQRVQKALAGRPPRPSAEDEWKERLLAQQNHECYLRERWRNRWVQNGVKLSQRLLASPRGSGQRVGPWLRQGG